MRDSGIVVFKICDSVPSARYSSVCNVLHQWRIWLIPTYRVYRLYDVWLHLIHLFVVMNIYLIIIYIVILYNCKYVFKYMKSSIEFLYSPHRMVVLLWSMPAGRATWRWYDSSSRLELSTLLQRYVIKILKR